MKGLVMGAVPAGAATALLARYGVDVKLVERERQFERVFRGEGLMPLGIHALFEMGLGGVLETVPGRRVDSWDIWIDGEEVFVTQQFFDRRLGERRVLPERARLFGVFEEGERAAGDQVYSCLVAGYQKKERHRQEFVVGELVARLICLV